MNDSLNILITFLHNRILEGQFNFDGRFLYLQNLSVADFDSLSNAMNELELQIEGNRREVTMDLHAPYPDDTFIFFDKAHFLRSYEKYKSDFDEKNLVILNLSNQLLLKKRSQTFNKDLALFFNYNIFRQTLSFLLNTSDFTAVHKEAQHQFVILSLEKGTFHIGYNPIEERVDTVHDLAPSLEELKSSFAKIEFVNFFKDAVIQAVGKEPIEDRFWALISSLRATLSFADRDFQIYVRKFAFDKIKSKFKEEKVKYFESLEKNIESLNKQVVAFPLTFAASAFAGYQVKDKPIILFLILLAYCAYTWVAFRILGITKYNIETTKGDVKKEANKIKATYDVLFKEFEDDFNNIEKKIDLLEKLTLLIKWVIFGLLVLFAAFSIYSMFWVKQAQHSQFKIPQTEIEMSSPKILDTSVASRKTIKLTVDSTMAIIKDSVSPSPQPSQSKK